MSDNTPAAGDNGLVTAALKMIPILDCLARGPHRRTFPHVKPTGPQQDRLAAARGVRNMSEARGDVARDLAWALREQCGLCMEARLPTARVKPVHIDEHDAPVHRAIDDLDYGCEHTTREAKALIAYDAALNAAAPAPSAGDALRILSHDDLALLNHVQKSLSPTWAASGRLRALIDRIEAAALESTKEGN